jgi:hypothetical protein
VLVRRSSQDASKISGRIGQFSPNVLGLHWIYFEITDEVKVFGLLFPAVQVGTYIGNVLFLAKMAFSV